MPLINWGQSCGGDSPTPFWWALDFTQAGKEIPGKGERAQWICWRECREDYPRVIGFLKFLRRQPVHITEFVALLITVLIYKNRIGSDEKCESWSPLSPLKVYCDNQATVAVINSGFSLKVFSDSDLEKDYLNFEILANILFRDILTISIDSPVGRAFKNREFPHLTDTMHQVEVPILPVYVHTSLCTADHLTRGRRQILGGTPVRIDKNQCIAHFGREFNDFVAKQVPFEELLGILDFLEKRTLHWRNLMKGTSWTKWGGCGKRNPSWSRNHNAKKRR